MNFETHLTLLLLTVVIMDMKVKLDITMRLIRRRQ